MRHYRIVKKTTFAVIAISVFAIVFNIALFTAAGFGFIQLSKPSSIKAEDTCSGNDVFTDLVSTTTNIQINESFSVRIYAFDTSAQKHYSYQFYIRDSATNKTYMVGDPQQGLLGGFTHFLSINSPGVKYVYAKYILEQNGVWCTDWPNTNEIQITGVDNATNSANVSITVPEKTDQGQNVQISYAITGAAGKKYALYVSKGGTCPDDTDNASCWSLKDSGEMTLDSFGGYVDWSTTDSDIGRHAVKIKVFEQNNTLTDTKIAYTTICAPGTAATTCVANNGGGQIPGGGTTGADDITTPTLITDLKHFPGITFILPKHINGAGDFAIAILALLQYLIGALAFISLCIGGIQYITSGGDSAKAEKAKKTIIYSVVGIIVAVWSYIILGIAANFWSGPK